MDTQKTFMDAYVLGSVTENACSVPAWAKKERLEYLVPLIDIWRMGESAVRKRKQWNLKRFFKNSIMTCLPISTECATADSFRKTLSRKPLSGQQ